MSSRLRIKKRPLPGKAGELHVSLLNRIALRIEEQVPIPPSGTGTC
jgi:hypothetical protein